MRSDLHLTLTTPSCVVVKDLDIVSLRAEDDSGSFGIRPGHADFVTLLGACVVRWRTSDGSIHFCAVDGGVLRVSRGSHITIACRQAIEGESLERLEADVRRARAAQADAERRARVEQTRLHAHAIRQLMRYLRPAKAGQSQGPQERSELPP
ncbi:F0F1 ATP synthase subunit epsilon [Trinickia symbiotica]|uniref:ATP synthase epsilon chain n=1 Tax=Trinickia symbiotica TaxID=863227 RepID=A0A2T3XRE1_9BURK|nr:F0F1 ATP synthase subunit epsilon [Trinickia symbiotica]PTB19022.1 F0F1 ATP synthase subunit epsilon [Trinickia symbiotica]